MRARALELVQAQDTARHNPMLIGLYLLGILLALIEALAAAQ